MTSSDVDGLTGAVTGLTGEIQSLRAETQELHVYGRRNRALIWRQWVLGILVVLVVVALIPVVISTHRTATGVQRNAENAYSACLKANEARKTTVDLWSYILSLPPTHPLSSQEQALVNISVTALRAKIATSYAQQDCSKLK